MAILFYGSEIYNKTPFNANFTMFHSFSPGVLSVAVIPVYCYASMGMTALFMHL
jgi:hypothetical protein